MEKNMQLLLTKLEEKLNIQTVTITNAVTKNVMEALNEKLETITKENNILKLKVLELEQKLNVMDKNNRKNNLVFFGVKEAEKSENELVKCIREIIIDMKVQIDSQEISHAFRIGRWNKDKNRPIVVTFNTTWKKQLIMRNKKRCPPNIYIKEDYSKEVLEKRRQLQPQLHEERNKGNIAFLKYDKLIVKTPSERTRDKRKREESQSPGSTTQKKANSQHEPTLLLPKTTTKETIRPNILNYIERVALTSTTNPPKN